MDTRWFEDILVLIEEGTLTGAAERRAVTQPAFSRRIRAFETWLGQDVIDRTTNRVVIRDALKRSEPDIRAFLQRLREVQQALRHARDCDPAGHFRDTACVDVIVFSGPDKKRSRKWGCR